MKQKIQEASGAKITWQELKQACENAGIKDSDQLDAVHITWGHAEAIKCTRDDDFGWQIILDCDC